MSRNPKVLMEREALRLITAVTDIEEEDEDGNFEICRRFALSNLFYHKYLDPEESKVNKTLEGIKQKFLIHAQPEKAQVLTNLLEKYNNSPLFQERLDQFDIRYRLLSLIIHLADSPVNAEYIPSEDQAGSDKEEEVDWLAVLRQDELPLEPLGSESDLSEWSEDNLEFEDHLGHQPLHQSFMLHGNEDHSTEDQTSSIHSEVNIKVESSQNWLRKNIQFPYWSEEQPYPVKSSDESANFAKISESWQADMGKIDVRTEKITEYQLIREILWILRYPTSSFIFPYRNGKFCVKEGITVTSLSEAAFKNITGEIIPVITDLQTLTQFVSGIETSLSFVSKVGERSRGTSHTMEAYISGIDNFLHNFSEYLLQIEESKLNHENNQAETPCVTILSLLQDLAPWMRNIAQLTNIHRLIVDGMKEQETWYTAMKILCVLYNHTVVAMSTPDILHVILDLFIRTIKPYFRIIQNWLTLGRLEDYQEEFVIYKSSTPAKSTEPDHEALIDSDDTDIVDGLEPDTEEVDFWTQLFHRREYKDRLAKQGIKTIGFLENILEKIFVSGKSIEILARLDKITSFEEGFNTTFDEENNHADLYLEFTKNIRIKLKERAGIASEPREIELYEENDTFHINKQDSGADYDETLKTADDPHLCLAFKLMMGRSDHLNESAMVQTPDVGSQPHSTKYTGTVLGLDHLEPIVTLDPILVESIEPLINNHYVRSCKSLVDLFTEHLNLERTLSYARKVYLMEAGDIMNEFCSQIFKLLETRDLDLLDSSSLTLRLQDCLSQRYAGCCDSFSCSYDPPGDASILPTLQGFDIHMDIPWPLSIVISPSSLKTYNKVFCFLAGVKRALWVLQSLRPSDLLNLENQLEMESDLDTTHNMSNVSFAVGHKKHRMQLLRSWLMYFVTVMHGYFMTRVIHSTELEVKDELAKAQDLDRIIEVHHNYINKMHDRCFLHPSARMLRKSVETVLAICIEVREAFNTQTVHSRMITAWEEKYFRHHSFLANTLQTMVKERRVPHLEGLAAALLHSCPQ